MGILGVRISSIRLEPPMTRTSRALACLLGGVCAALAAAPSARADVVTLADGRVLEGSVTTSGKTVIIRHRLGEVRVDRSQVVKVVETEDAWDTLERLRAELASGTADERYRFAVFCREERFDADAQRAFLSVLRVDTDHPGARAALGYLRHDGRWVTADDRSRALGLVQHDGEWMTPEARAARVEQARQLAEARRAEREAELARARERREAEREADRAARRERAELYAREVVREQARQRALDSYERPYGVLGAGSYTPLSWGRYRVVSTPWGGGFYSPPCPVVIRRGARYGSQLGGSYTGGGWRLNWRLGF